MDNPIQPGVGCGHLLRRGSRRSGAQHVPGTSGTITRARHVALRTAADGIASVAFLHQRPGLGTTLAAVKVAIRRDKKMSKEELIQFEGLVIESLPDARYRVQLDAGYEVVAYTAGKMKKKRVKTLAGDRVTIEMSPYDLHKGRLVFRHKDER